MADENIRINWWQIIKWSGGGILLILLLWMGIASAIWGFRVATAGIYGAGEARREIQSAPFRIGAYQTFFNQCASIQGLEGQIDEITVQLEVLESGTRSYDLTLSSLTGTKGLRHRAVAQYNQDALKDYTQGQFRDADLPYQLVDSNYPSEGGKTICAVQ